MKSAINQETIRKAAKASQLAKVLRLDLSVMNIDSIQNLDLVPRLQYLVLSCNRITSIENIRCLPQLKELHMESNLLRRISGLEGNKNLVFLNLSNNQIEKIENLTAQVHLETLNLENNRIGKFSGIDSLKSLRNINLSNNLIDVLGFIPAFSRLEVVNLSHNQIKAIMPDFFQNSPNIMHLNVSHNRLTRMEFVEVLLNLQTLDLSHNKIEHFNPQGVFKHLEELYLSNNEITELPYFALNFPDLTILDLDNNFVTNEFSLLQAIGGSESLVELHFEGNPMHSPEFEDTVAKVNMLEVVNSRVFGQQGSKYKERMDNIVNEFRMFPEIYLRDDEDDLQLKRDGFYSEDLEFELTGNKPNRPPSPQRLKPSEKEWLDKYDEFRSYMKASAQNVKNIQKRCKDIWHDLGWADKNAVRETEPETKAQVSQPAKQKEEVKEVTAKMEEKWREMKARQKTFQIREYSNRKRSSNLNTTEDKTENNENPVTSNPKLGKKPGKEKAELVLGKTYNTPFDQKIIMDVQQGRTQQRFSRPQSLKK